MIEFNGDWSYEVEIPAFEGFQSRGGAYTAIDSLEKNNGRIIIEFEDDLSENPDPYPEQFAALEYFINHQDEIIKNVLNQILIELPDIIVNYDLQNDPKYQDLTPSKIKSLIGFSTLSIMIPFKDEISYIDLVGGCDWDEEHGLNVLIHKERIIKVSGIDGTSFWDALDDNGTTEEVRKKMKIKTVPKKYKAHPKYNKLKPSHKSANDTFEHSLISGGHNDIFKELVENGEIDINGKWESQNKTFLEAACWFKNNEIAKFLLEKGADIRFALHQCYGYSYNPEGLDLILKHGGDINQKDLSGKTILNMAVAKLSSLYDGLAQNIKYGWNNAESIEKNIEEQKAKILALIELGGDLRIKDRYKFDCFDMSRNLPEQQKSEMDLFLNSLTPKPEKPKKKRWKFW